jgi:rubredoxin
MGQDIYGNHKGGENTGSPPSRMFRDLDATELYCPHCKMAVPVRKRLLLVLPEGDKYEYFCPYCAETVGVKIDQNQQQSSLIV